MGASVADFVFERDDTTVIVLRVPRRLWDRWESRHQHYGKAIYSLRESVLEVLAVKSLRPSSEDQGDPFWRS